jgi:hypothetical protein
LDQRDCHGRPGGSQLSGLRCSVLALGAFLGVILVAGCSTPTPVSLPVLPAARSAVASQSVPATGQAAFEQIGRDAVAALGFQDPDDPPKFVGVLANDSGAGDGGVTYWFYPTAVSEDGGVSAWFAAALGSAVVPRAASLPGVAYVTIAIVDPSDAPLVDTQVTYSRAEAVSADWSHIQSQAALPDQQGPGWLPFFQSASAYSVSQLTWSDAVRYYGKRLDPKAFPQHKL